MEVMQMSRYQGPFKVPEGWCEFDKDSEYFGPSKLSSTQVSVLRQDKKGVLEIWERLKRDKTFKRSVEKIRKKNSIEPNVFLEALQKARSVCKLCHSISKYARSTSKTFQAEKEKLMNLHFGDLIPYGRKLLWDDLFKLRQELSHLDLSSSFDESLAYFVLTDKIDYIPRKKFYAFIGELNRTPRQVNLVRTSDGNIDDEEYKSRNRRIYLEVTPDATLVDIEANWPFVQNLQKRIQGHSLKKIGSSPEKTIAKDFILSLAREGHNAPKIQAKLELKGIERNIDAIRKVIQRSPSIKKSSKNT